MKLTVLFLLSLSRPVFLTDTSAQSEFVSLAEMEDALLRNLFQGYQRWVRPIQHANDTIKVRFGLKISQLVDVVEMVWMFQRKEQRRRMEEFNPFA